MPDPAATRPVLLFDVNETLLDLRTLEPVFARVLGDAGARGGWFAQMLQISFVGAITGEYVDFTTAQHAALRMLAERLKVALSDAEADDVVGTMARLPAHPDVRAALERLAAAGFRMATLTNSPGPVVEAQLGFAGLRDLFEEALSADAVRRLKPAPEPYRHAAAVFGVPVESTMLVAAHPWDVAGALAAGARAAFVARPGNLLYPVGRRPEIIGRDLAAVADMLLARWPAGGRSSSRSSPRR